MATSHGCYGDKRSVLDLREERGGTWAQHVSGGQGTAQLATQ